MTSEPYPLSSPPDHCAAEPQPTAVLPVTAYLILILLLAYMLFQLATLDERTLLLLEKMSVDTEYVLTKKEL